MLINLQINKIQNIVQIKFKFKFKIKKNSFIDICTHISTIHNNSLSIA